MPNQKHPFPVKKFFLTDSIDFIPVNFLNKKKVHASGKLILSSFQVCDLINKNEFDLNLNLQYSRSHKRKGSPI